MNTLKLMFLSAFGLALPLFAGQVFGTITEGGKAVAAGTQVTIDCSGEQATAKTDNFGAFRLNVQKTGRCTLTLTYKGQNPATTVASLAEPVSADFDLQAQDGKYKLVRK